MAVFLTNSSPPVKNEKKSANPQAVNCPGFRSKMDREFKVDLLAGASAGAVGKIATHPIDTSKSLVQSGNNAATSAVQAFRSTWARGGAT